MPDWKIIVAATLLVALASAFNSQSMIRNMRRREDQLEELWAE